MKNIHKHRIIKEVIGLVLVFLIFAPIFYWRILGFKPLDNFFAKFQNDYPLVFYPLLFALLVFLLRSSWKEYKEGDNFEIIRVLLYVFIVVVILLGFILELSS